MARQGDDYYLVITDTVTEDSGIYMATANNGNGEAKSYGRLAVTQQVTDQDGTTIKSINVENVSKPSGSGQPPEFKKLFYDKEVKFGENFRLDATIMGSPKPRVSLVFVFV